MRREAGKTITLSVDAGRIVTSEGLAVAIPGVVVEARLAGGAHGEVFKAEDFIKRSVVVKVWTRSTTKAAFVRAQAEVAKLAALHDHHALFAAVYSFGIQPIPGQRDQQIAFAVLEYIEGVSGKAWLKTGPHDRARYTLWKLIRAALTRVYDEGMIHGDPHLGNVIVGTETKGRYKQYLPKGYGIHHHDERSEIAPWFVLPDLRIKMIDLGSSLLWEQRKDFSERECAVVREDFLALFPDIGGSGLGEDAASHPRAMLQSCDSWLEYSLLLKRYNPEIEKALMERSYSDLSPWQLELRDLLGGSPCLRESVIRRDLQRLGMEYDKILRR